MIGSPLPPCMPLPLCRMKREHSESAVDVSAPPPPKFRMPDDKECNVEMDTEYQPGGVLVEGTKHLVVRCGCVSG